jgi:hypothetical protein
MCGTLIRFVKRAETTRLALLVSVTNSAACVHIEALPSGRSVSATPLFPSFTPRFETVETQVDTLPTLSHALQVVVMSPPIFETDPIPNEF